MASPAGDIGGSKNDAGEGAPAVAGAQEKKTVTVEDVDDVPDPDEDDLDDLDGKPQAARKTRRESQLTVGLRYVG
jgi:peroxin-19